jgi:hypothetical protein
LCIFSSSGAIKVDSGEIVVKESTIRTMIPEQDENLILWWNFDGASVDDASSNSYDGTITEVASEVPIYTTHFGRECYYFTNTGCRIAVPLIALSNSWTVCVWIYGYSTGERQYWMGRHDDGRWNFSYGIYADDRKAAFQFKDNTWGSYAQPSGFQQWDFLTWVFDVDGSNGYTYMNGELKSTKDLDGIDNTLHYNSLGKSYPWYALPDSRAYYSFNGFADDLMIFDKALSSAEVNRVFFTIGTNTNPQITKPVITGDLDAYFPFCRRNKDESGNDVPMSVSGPIWNNDFEGVYDFDGADDSLTIPEASVPITLPFSISMWIKPDARADEVLIGNHVLVDYGWVVKIRSHGTVEFGVSDDGSHWSSANAGSYTAAEWSHVVVTFSATGSKIIYLNNSAVSTVNTGYTDVNIPSANTTIGLIDSSSQDFTGYMDEVCIYGDVLTSTEVGQIYLAGTNTHYNAPPPPP